MSCSNYQKKQVSILSLLSAWMWINDSNKVIQVWRYLLQSFTWTVFLLFFFTKLMHEHVCWVDMPLPFIYSALPIIYNCKFVKRMSNVDSREEVCLEAYEFLIMLLTPKDFDIKLLWPSLIDVSTLKVLYESLCDIPIYLYVYIFSELWQFLKHHLTYDYEEGSNLLFLF